MIHGIPTDCARVQIDNRDSTITVFIPFILCYNCDKPKLFGPSEQKHPSKSSPEWGGGPRGERQARPFWNFDGTRQHIVKHHVQREWDSMGFNGIQWGWHAKRGWIMCKRVQSTLTAWTQRV